MQHALYNSDIYIPKSSSHLDIMNNLLVTGVKDIKVNSKKQICIAFYHEKFEGKEIYCVKRWVQVISEGSSELLTSTAMMVMI